MKQINLSQRLSAAAAWVPLGARLCDVGTDHAALPIRLMQEGRVRRAIATDIRQGPLDRARGNVERYSYTGQTNAAVRRTGRSAQGGSERGHHLRDGRQYDCVHFRGCSVDPGEN